MRTISQPLLTFLLNACWQIALITAVAAFCAWLLRGTTARCQHLLWVTALAFSFGLPVLTCASLLGGEIFSEPPRTTIQPSDEALAPATQLVTDMQESLPTAPPAALEETAPFILINRNVAAVIVVLYLLFLCYRSGKLFMAWMRARSLKRSAYLIELPEHVRTTLSECQSVLGMRHVQVLCSASIPAPIAVGGFNPLIILPEQLFKETDRGVLTAAIGHELVHILRRDYLLNLIYELISLPLSFHPATTLVKRRIRETRELGCDELVTEKLLDAAVYARSLVYLAGSAINLSRPGATITVGIADADILEERVMTILRRPKTNTRRRNLLLVATALIFVVPCVAAAPFSLRIGVDLQAPAVSSDDSIVTPHASDLVVQQGATQKAKQEERATKERRYKLIELGEKDRLKRNVSEIEAAPQKVRKLRDASSTQELEAKHKEARLMQKRLTQEREAIQKKVEETREQREARERRVAKQQAELAKKASITMQQAIQIALSQQTGTLIECHLIERQIGDKDQIFYELTIVSGDEPESASTYMLISAVNGRIVATRKY
jgi:bla regulator protein blaR1